MSDQIGPLTQIAKELDRMSPFIRSTLGTDARILIDGRRLLIKQPFATYAFTRPNAHCQFPNPFPSEFAASARRCATAGRGPFRVMLAYDLR
jgi:hypothetical protein